MAASKTEVFFNRIKLSLRTNGRPRKAAKFGQFWRLRAAEFCELTRGIWQNLRRETVGPSHDIETFGNVIGAAEKL